jgi:hypothetical protein
MSAEHFKRDEIIQAALNAGFVLHTGFGQHTGQLMPVSDVETLWRFGEMLGDLLERADPPIGLTQAEKMPGTEKKDG